MDFSEQRQARATGSVMRTKQIKSRVLYFRLSEEEYQLCAQLCDSEHIATMSDLIRRAISRYIQEASTQTRPDLALTCFVLRRAIDDLNRHVAGALSLIGERDRNEAASSTDAAGLKP